MAVKYTIKPIKVETFELDLDKQLLRASETEVVGTHQPIEDIGQQQGVDVGDISDYIVLPTHSLQNLAGDIPTLRTVTPQELMELQPQQFMKDMLSGNLLGDDQHLSIAAVEDQKIMEFEDKIVIKDPEHQGQLIVFMNDSDGHKPGDFIYQCSGNVEGIESNKIFHYSLADVSGNIAHFTLNLEFSKDGPVITSPDIGSIDEEVLIPGTHEESKVSGFLGIESDTSETTGAKFKPLVEQQALIDLELTSQGVPLYYTLSDNMQTIAASKGANGDTVFEVNLLPDGSYEFSLYSPIDRTAPENLAENNHLNLEYLLRKKWGDIDEIPGWQVSDLSQPQTGALKMAMAQEIATEPNHPYQLQFYYTPPAPDTTEPQSVEVWWGDQFVYELNEKQLGTKGFSFTLDAKEGDSTELKFIASASEQSFNGTIDQISVMDTQQQQLPLPFNFSWENNLGEVLHNEFAVNVTTTPPLTLSYEKPFTVIYDQSVYQSIVVNDDNPLGDVQNTLNLESLFDNMAIAQENRLVSIVQQQKDGQATNIYEVQISDKNDELAPITVADVKLSFSGGDGGLEVFHRNIHIDEGTGH